MATEASETLHWCRIIENLGNLLWSERSERDTIKGGQLKSGICYIHIYYMLDIFTMLSLGSDPLPVLSENFLRLK